MLRNVDVHAQPRERKIKVGDLVRFPIDDLHRPRQGIYRHTFEVVSFGFVTTSWCGPRDGSRPMWRERSSNRHMVTVRRLVDGWTTTVGARHVVHYREEDCCLTEQCGSRLGHNADRRLARMRGEHEYLKRMADYTASRAREARAIRRQREIERRYARTGVWRITFTLVDDTPLPEKSVAA